MKIDNRDQTIVDADSAQGHKRASPNEIRVIDRRDLHQRIVLELSLNQSAASRTALGSVAFIHSSISVLSAESSETRVNFMPSSLVFWAWRRALAPSS